MLTADNSNIARIGPNKNTNKTQIFGLDSGVIRYLSGQDLCVMREKQLDLFTHDDEIEKANKEFLKTRGEEPIELIQKRTEKKRRTDEAARKALDTVLGKDRGNN